jgi:hypothetical protein
MALVVEMEQIECEGTIMHGGESEEPDQILDPGVQHALQENGKEHATKRRIKMGSTDMRCSENKHRWFFHAGLRPRRVGFCDSGCFYWVRGEGAGKLNHLASVA